MNPQELMETNVYAVRGRVLIVGACLPQVFPLKIYPTFTD